MTDEQLQLCTPDGTVRGMWLREEALDRLDNKYNEWISNRGLPALIIVAQKWPTFTADDVWEQLVNTFQAQPHERRVLGSVFRRAYKAGLISHTEIFEKSRMKQCHARKKPLWKSNIQTKQNEETTPNDTNIHTEGYKRKPIKIGEEE